MGEILTLSKKYQIIVKLDMRNIMHTGQNLMYEWSLSLGKETYILQINLDFSWILINSGGIILEKGENFDQFLKDTGQQELLS